MKNTHFSAVVASCLAVFVPSEVAAQPSTQHITVTPADRARATMMFNAANDLIGTDPGAAAEMLRRAYALSGISAFLFNAGIGFERAHNDAEALHWFEQYESAIARQAVQTQNDRESLIVARQHMAAIRLRLHPVIVSPPPVDRTPHSRTITDRPVSIVGWSLMSAGAVAAVFTLYSVQQALYAQGMVDEAIGQPLTPRIDQYGRSIQLAWTGASISGLVSMSLLTTGFILHVLRPTRVRQVMALAPGPTPLGLTIGGSF